LQIFKPEALLQTHFHLGRNHRDRGREEHRQARRRRSRPTLHQGARFQSRPSRQRTPRLPTHHPRRRRNQNRHAHGAFIETRVLRRKLARLRRRAGQLRLPHRRSLRRHPLQQTPSRDRSAKNAMTLLRPLVLSITSLVLALVSLRAADPLQWTNPIAAQRADPHVILHTDGYYYLTATVPEYDRIELRRARTLGELSTAEPKVIWRKHADGPMGAHIWAPEIHFIDGKWYVYFAAGETKRIWNIRM